MSCVIIYPGLSLPTASSDPPKSVTGSHIAFCSVLLRMGFTCARPVTRSAVVSYTAFPPLPAYAGGISLLHYPWSRLRRTLSGILPYEARTFLTWPLSVLPAAITCPTCLYRLARPMSVQLCKQACPSAHPQSGAFYVPYHIKKTNASCFLHLVDDSLPVSDVKAAASHEFPQNRVFRNIF